MHQLFTIFLLLFTIFPLFSQASSTQVEIGFIADSRFGKVNGKFSRTKIVISPDEKSAQVQVEISSIQTGNSMRDKHLLDEDFFHAEKYPNASFVLVSLTPIDDNHYRGTGKLTIREVTKDLVFSLTKKGDGKKYTGTTEINRFDFGIKYDSVINKISEKVIINFTITKE